MEVLKHINAIIERENKTSTYKFALLRAVIEIIRSGSRHVEVGPDRCRIPMSMIAEKWILYYYPLLQEEQRIVQMPYRTLAIEPEFDPIISYYRESGGFSLLHLQLNDGKIPTSLIKSMISLYEKIVKTIKHQPMKHIGRSIFNADYGLFKFHEPETGMAFNLSEPENRIFGNGTVSIPRDYYDVFELFGSFILGTGGLLTQWADFCVKSTPDGTAMKHRIVDLLSQSPVLERDMKQAQEIYKRLRSLKGSLCCVWTDDILGKYEIDHVIPFSAHYNNELWNLLPASPSVNRQKSDKIPSSVTLEKRKTEIISYWQDVSEINPGLFFNQLKYSLTGFRQDDDWKELAFVRLKESCHKLIQDRGYNIWEPK
jgi:hypothetical protein